MIDIFLYSFNAIIPILGIILLGYILKRTDFLSDDFLNVGNKLMFRVCLPCMLYYNIYSIESFSVINPEVIWYSIISVFVLFFIGWLSGKLVPDPKQKGAVHQCAFRSNYAIIGIVLASSLGDETSVAVASILSAVVISLFNILAVISLTMYDDGGKTDFKKIIIRTLKNPLIISIFMGVATIGLRNLVPFSIKNDLPAVYSIISSLAKMASPLALIVLGGKFTFSASRKLVKQIALATSTRIIIAPILGLCGAIILTKMGILHFTKTEFPALIALFGTPVAVSSTVMASEMGSDEILAGQLVVWTSILSIFTLFVTVSALRFFGYL